MCFVLSRRRVPQPAPELSLCGAPLRTEPNPRYLGLTLDPRLDWQAHIGATASKATRTLGAIRKLVSGLKGRGAPASVFVRLYKALVRPQLDYGCELVVCAPPAKLAPLQKVHRQALRSATGAPLAVSTDALCADLAVQPLEVRWRMLLLRWEARILRLVPTHPLRVQWLASVRPALLGPRGALMSTWNQRLGGSLPQRLANVHDQVGLQLEAPATVEPLGVRPAKLAAAAVPPLSRCPAAKGDRAAARDWAAAQVSAALSDPSAAVAFAVGACAADTASGAGAFWLQRAGHPRQLRASLFGPGADLLGMQLFAIGMCLRHVWEAAAPAPLVLHLFSDSPSALEWLAGLQAPHTYVTLVNELVRLVAANASAGRTLRLYSVPGHAGVAALDEVGRLAKVVSLRHSARSALGEAVAAFMPTPFLVARRLISAACLAHWGALWRTVAGVDALRALKPTPVAAPEHWSGPRARDRDLFLLRHACCLNAFLFRIAASPSPLCPFRCGVDETPAHLLLECAAYSAARATLRAVVAEHCGDVALSLPLLLGSSAGPRGVRVAIADAVAAFVRQCGRALLMSPSLVLALG